MGLEATPEAWRWNKRKPLRVSSATVAQWRFAQKTQTIVLFLVTVFHRHMENTIEMDQNKVTNIYSSIGASTYIVITLSNEINDQRLHIHSHAGGNGSAIPTAEPLSKPRERCVAYNNTSLHFFDYEYEWIVTSPNNHGLLYKLSSIIQCMSSRAYIPTKPTLNCGKPKLHSSNRTQYTDTVQTSGKKVVH